MKVLHVIPFVGRLRGGPSFAIRTLTSMLVAQGISAEVATTDDNGPERLAVPYRQPVDEGGVIYRYFPLDAQFYSTSLALARWLNRSIASYQAVHIHMLFSACSTVAAEIAYRNRIPYLVQPQGVLNRWGMTQRRPWLKKLSFSLIEKRILDRAALVYYTSEQEREEASLLGVRTPSIVLPNPVDLGASSTPEPNASLKTLFPQLDGCKIALFLSRIDPKKGLDLLLPAFAQVVRQEPRARLVIAGTGPAGYIAGLRAQATRLGIDSVVSWCGFLDGPAKSAAFREADVFILPSYSESFGIAVVEAMARRLPVIITDQVGIHRDVSRSDAGIVTTCTVPSIAKALQAILCNDTRRRPMGLNAHRLATTSFSPQAVAASLARHYTAMCDRAIPVPCKPA